MENLTCKAERDAVLTLFEAINSKDLDRFLSVLHPDVIYRFHHQGFAPAQGHDAMRAVWSAMLESLPDMHEEVLSLDVSPGHAVAHWRMTASLSGPWPLGSRIVVPPAPQPPCSILGVDIFRLEGGLILAKDTYADVGVWFEAYADLPKFDPAELRSSVGAG